MRKHIDGNWIVILFLWTYIIEDAMATEKLTSGIKKFAEDLDKLEVLVR